MLWTCKQTIIETNSDWIHTNLLLGFLGYFVLVIHYHSKVWGQWEVFLYFWKKSLMLSNLFKQNTVKLTLWNISFYNLFENVIYSCDGKAEAITPIFNATWSFRTHSNMVICCSGVFIFTVDKGFVLFDEKKKLKRTEVLWIEIFCNILSLLWHSI